MIKKMNKMNKLNKGKTRFAISKIFSFINIINALICAALFITMIILASLYVVRSQYYESKTEKGIPVDTLLMLKQGGKAVPDTFDISLITPEFIGFDFENGAVGIAFNDEIVLNVYTAASDYIKYVLGESYKCEKTDAIRGEAEWKACLAGNNYIYIRYPASLPAEIIYAFFNSGKMPAGTEVIFIREIFLIFSHYGDNLYAVHAVVRDDEGNVAIYNYDYNNSEPRKYFKTDAVSSYYGNDFFINYKFAKNHESLNDTSIIFNKEIAAREINVTYNAVRFFNNDPNDPLLIKFGYNPKRLSPYTKSDGTLVYVENHGTLKIQPDNMIIYEGNSDNGGINISDYLSYGNYNDNYDIFEIIKATGIIINQIRSTESGLLGGQAGLRISGISLKDEGLILDYRYYFDNIIIIDNQPGYTDACRFIIKDNKIMNIYIKSLSVSGSSKKMNYPQLWVFDKIDDKIKNLSKGDIFLAYILDSNRESTYLTKWIYKSNDLDLSESTGIEVILNNEVE
jgi:hypothetical protein